MNRVRFTVLMVFMLVNWLTCLEAKGQAIDTLNQEKALYQDSSISEADAYEGTDDFSPGLLFFALIGLGFILACIGAGIAVTVISLLIVFGLIAIGVLSTSVIIGLYNRSFAKGFKTFIVLLSSISGMVACAAGLGIINAIGNWWTVQTAVMTGVAVGIVAGIGFGYLAYYILQHLITLFMNKLRLNDKDKMAIGNTAQA